MDSNYLYMRASQEEEDFSNGSGWLSGLFKGGGDGGGDGKNTAAIGLAALGVFGTLLSTRKARKEKEAADAIAAANRSGGGGNNNDDNTPSKAPLIIVGVLAVVGIGIAIYFGTRKK